MDQIWTTTSYYHSNSALILWSAGSQRTITSDWLLRLQIGYCVCKMRRARRSLNGVLSDGAERRGRLPWKAAGVLGTSPGRYALVSPTSNMGRSSASSSSHFKFQCCDHEPSD